jgi:dihydroxyacetone kinase-like protein
MSESIEIDGAAIRAWLRSAGEAIEEKRDYLTQLDAAIGDADHGVNMSRGFRALGNGLEDGQQAGPGRELMSAGTTLSSGIGGASGALWGTALRRAGRSLGDAQAVALPEFVAALEAAVRGVQELGAVVEGEKTMIDSLAPAVAALRREVDGGSDWAVALGRAREAAEAGMRATVPMLAGKGRAAYLGERSIGHQDPGATSAALIVGALEAALGRL